MTQDLEDFLTANRIEKETWGKSGCKWGDLLLIKADYLGRLSMLERSAALYVNVIQTIPRVHSVRSRIKNPDHVLEKIVRKCALEEEKYKSITIENYFEVITDLVGIRALHLFKEDCFEVARNLLGDWSPVETPIAYIRAGDPDALKQKYREAGMEVKEHPNGYRSVHCVLSSQPLNKPVFFEVQIRTVFEEGWSEIDHVVRYPNFSDNELVDYFLAIFNRMAGSADEMGSFVTGLASSILENQEKISNAQKERDESLMAIEKLLGELHAYKEQGVKQKDTVKKLQAEVSKLRNERLASEFVSAADDPRIARRALDSLANFRAANVLLRGQNNPFARSLLDTSSTLLPSGDIQKAEPD